MLIMMIFGSSRSEKPRFTWTFIIVFILFHGNIDSNATLIKLPTKQATIATNVTGLEINSGDILSPNECSWTFPGLLGGFLLYQSSFGGCTSSTTATYSISCSESSGVVSSNLTILTPLTSNVSVVMLCSSLSSSSPQPPSYNLQVIVKDCTSPTPSNVPVNPPTGVYNTPAHFQCSQNSTLFYASGRPGNTATKCLASAEWETEKIVQCWSAPTATLIGNNTHYVGDKATFQCNVVGGFPLADRVEVYFNGQIQALNGNTWTSTALTSSNHGDIVECRAISNYTSIAVYRHLGIDKITLNVYFPAEQFKVNNGLNDVCEWTTSGPQWCSITFTLNPILHSTILTKDGLSVQNDIEYTPQNTMIQNFLFMRNKPSENETGSYKLTVMSSKFKPVDFSFTIIVSQSSQACDQRADSVVIVGSILASIIFILLITNVYQFCKYRNAKPIAEDRNQGNINLADADYVELDDAMRSNKFSQQNLTQQQHPYVNTGASVNAIDQSYMDIQAVQPRDVGTSSDGYEVVTNRNYENMGSNWKKEGQSEYEI